MCEGCGVHELGVSNELGEVVLVGGILQLTLGDGLALRVIDDLIGIAHDVEDDVIVGRVEVVTVLEPIGGVDVNLYVPHPIEPGTVGLLDADMGIGEVGTGVGVMDSDRQDFDTLTVGRYLRERAEEFALPNIMQ